MKVFHSATEHQRVWLSRWSTTFANYILIGGCLFVKKSFRSNSWYWKRYTWTGRPGKLNCDWKVLSFTLFIISRIFSFWTTAFIATLTLLFWSTLSHFFRCWAMACPTRVRLIPIPPLGQVYNYPTIKATHGFFYRAAASTLSIYSTPNYFMQ